MNAFDNAGHHETKSTLFLFLSIGIVEAQTQLNDNLKVSDTISVLFYNVENLFDDKDDEIEGDELVGLSVKQGEQEILQEYGLIINDDYLS